MAIVSRLISVAAFAAVTCEASVASRSEHPRLNEIELDLELMGHKLPIDPDGTDGPKRIAGYFALNRTEVRDWCEEVTLSKCVGNDPSITFSLVGSGNVLFLLREPK